MATLAAQVAYEEPIMSDIEELEICDTGQQIISDTITPTHEQNRRPRLWLLAGERLP